MWRESKITRVSIMSEIVRTTQLTENDAFGSRLETKENRIITRTFNRQPQPYWNEPTQTNTTKIHSKQVKEPEIQSTNRIRILSGLKSFVFPHWQSCKSQITLTKMCWRISQTPFSQMWVISQHPLTYKQPQGMLGPGARSPGWGWNRWQQMTCEQRWRCFSGTGAAYMLQPAADWWTFC